jgi:hypothetical protein
LSPRNDFAEAFDRSFGDFHVTVASSGRRAQFIRCRLLALVLVAGELLLLVRQIHQESKPPDAIGADFLAVDDRRSVEKLKQILPVELLALLEFSASGAQDQKYRAPARTSARRGGGRAPGRAAASRTCRGRRCRAPCCADKRRGLSGHPKPANDKARDIDSHERAYGLTGCPSPGR